MTPREFRQERGLEYDHFQQLTNTGITPNYVNIELFAHEYHRAKLKLLGITDVSGWVSLEESYPNENETVWLYNIHTNFVALGCRVWVGGDGDEAGWMWALSNGIIYADKGKIVAECEVDDDYVFTHWSRLPSLPCSQPTKEELAKGRSEHIDRFTKCLD